MKDSLRLDEVAPIAESSEQSEVMIPAVSDGNQIAELVEFRFKDKTIAA